MLEVHKEPVEIFSPSELRLLSVAGCGSEPVSYDTSCGIMLRILNLLQAVETGRESQLRLLSSPLPGLN